MGNIIPKIVSFNLPDGKKVEIETGKLATQAHGAVVVKVENTMIFASVVGASEEKPGQSFFPLSVDYQEKFSAAGKIPGNFFRRESRLSDYEILISRLVDRAIRPLFPDGYKNETQVIINLISGDKDNMPDCYAALAASAALAVSNIPFAGPISEVRVAKINGEYVVNPIRSLLVDASLDLIIAATDSDVMMVEGEAKECQEHELIEAIKIGHDAIKVQIKAQLELANLVGESATVKRPLVIAEVDQELKDKIKELAKNDIIKVAKAALDKQTRKSEFDKIGKATMEALTAVYGEVEFLENKKPKAGEYFDKLKKETIRGVVLDDSIRLDGRKLDEVRPIWTEIGYLPAAHGSAIFNRGETQALTSLTLGAPTDSQMIDNALDHHNEKFILHYNFPALSVGEIKPMRGPGRREVGHANLAGRSLKQVLPPNPYTIRIISDILESNGSSSMATVCAGSLALMDAGIKITSPVSGIAMGMIAEGSRVAILSDILGDEDALGDMDFKVTGTVNGITGCQMDIKIDGLPYETLEKALTQAKAGRIHIINEMNKTIATANADLKPHAPRITELIIDKSFIGAVIGPGGKIIQDIQARSGAVISIEEVGNTGVVAVTCSDKDGMELALNEIRRITFTPTVGDIYDAEVESVVTFGVFVKFAGKSGLVHVSELDHKRINDVSEFFKEGDKLKVKYIGDDQKTGKMRLSRKAILDNPA
jgi:polyribonucleotide nucleotidyltransferase